MRTRKSRRTAKEGLGQHKAPGVPRVSTCQRLQYNQRINSALSCIYGRAAAMQKISDMRHSDPLRSPTRQESYVNITSSSSIFAQVTFDVPLLLEVSTTHLQAWCRSRQPICSGIQAQKQEKSDSFLSTLNFSNQYAKVIC